MDESPFEMPMSSIYADELKPGHRIIIETHFFPKGEKGSKLHNEDEISFMSDFMWVVSVTKNRLKVKGKDGHIAYIPLEDHLLSSFCTGKNITKKTIKPPVHGLHFFIWKT